MKGKFVAVFVVLWAALSMVAGDVVAAGLAGESPKRPKVALVLCGGGAKGAAHIGVLKVLEEADVPIDMIVGTSIGGLVGGLYSMGYSASQLDSIVRGCDWKYLLSDNSHSRQDESFDGKSQDARYLLKVPFYSMHMVASDSPISRLPSGLISGQNVLNLLNGLAMGYQEEMDFKDLPIPFACIATDLSTGEAVVLDSGKLPIAMRATMAIPGVFSPVEIDGRILVDGGVINNFPVDVARNMGADIVIGVDIKNDSPQVEHLRALPQVLIQMINLMGADTHQRNVADVDILIKPDVSKYSTFSFNDPAIAQLIINGEVAAKEKYGMLDTLARRLNTLSVLAQMQNFDAKPAVVMRDTFCFKSVSITGIEKKNEHWLRRMSGLRPGVKLTIAEINKGVSILMGTKAFSAVTYTVLGQGTDDERLVVNIKKGPTNVVALGARYDSEEAAGLLFHVGANEMGLLGSKLEFTARLSYNPYGEVNYSYTSKDFPKIEFNYKVGGMDMNIYKSTENQNNLSFVYQTGELNLANIYLRNFDFKLGARYEHYDFSKYLKQNIPDGYQEYSLEDSSYESFYFRGRMDNRDDDYFASGGMLVDVEGTYWQSNYTSSFDKFGAVKLILNGALRAGEKLVFLPQFYGRVLLGECKEIPYINYIGGSEPGRYFRQQLPFIGINYANPVSSAVMIGRVDLRQRIGSNHYIYGMANYMRFASNFGNVFSDKGYGIWGLGIKYAYSTPIGPLSLNLHWSDLEHKFGAYVSLGHYF